MRPIKSETLQFLLSHGGMGDLIYMIQPLRYLLDNYPHINGYVIVKSMVRDLFTLWLKDFSPRITVTGDVYREMNTIAPQYQMPDPMGFDLESLAWMYIANRDLKDVDPKYRKFPRIEGDEADLSKYVLPDKYAVICVGATAPNRVLLPDVVDGLSDYFLARGITPVYLGKKVLAKGYMAHVSGDLTKGIDLVDQTTGIEAACVMAKAKIVVGVDGGLLHLAGCTDVPIVMALTAAGKRDFSHMREAPTIFFASPVECKFCQEKYRYVIGHHFRECIEDTYACVKLLTKDLFIEQIEKII